MPISDEDRPEANRVPVYLVMVDDNYHHMDRDYRYVAGRYRTMEQAITACKKIVDESLIPYFKPGMSAEELFSGYKGFGEDPWIAGEDKVGLGQFSAWTYAERRCKELAGEGTTVR